MNSKLLKTIKLNNHKISGWGYYFIDCYNLIIRNDGLCGTITTGISSRNEVFILERKENEKNKK